MRASRFALVVVSLFSGLFLAGGVLGAAGAGPFSPATTRVYPGAGPCANTLQARIDGSNPGDVISLAGSYTQSFTLDKAVSLAGAGAGQTVLSAAPFQRVFTVTYTTTQPVLISGLTISGGNVMTNPSFNFEGGGVAIQSPVSIAFDGVVFRDNQAGSGGGLWTDVGVSVTITASQFISNVASDVAGLSVNGEATLDHTDFVGNLGGGAFIQTGHVNASRFERNTSRGGLWAGGAVSVTDSDFLTNTAFVGGGLQADGPASVTGGRFQANQATLQGGAAFFAGSALVSGVTATNNLAADGGAFFFSNLGQSAVVTHSLLAGNAASSTAGTAGIVYGYGRVPTETQDVLANTVLTGPGTPGSRALQVGLGRSLQQSVNTLSAYTVESVNLGQQTTLPSPIGLITTTGPGLCPVVFTYTRPVTVWFGSTYANGVPVINVDSASQFVNATVLNAVYAGGHDARLGAGLVPWTDFQMTDITWTLSTTGNLDAEQNLRTALAAAWLPAPYTRVRFSQPVSRGVDSFITSTFDDDYLCNGHGVITRHSILVARLTYFELDATAIFPLFLPVVRR